MDRNVRAAVYGVVGVVGVVVLYAALAHPPVFDARGSGAATGASDTGVHLDADGTIDYYHENSFTLYDNALPVFVVTAGLGFALFAKGSKELVEFARHRTDGTAESGQGSNTGS